MSGLAAGEGIGFICSPNDGIEIMERLVKLETPSRRCPVAELFRRERTSLRKPDMIQAMARSTECLQKLEYSSADRNISVPLPLSPQ